MTIRERLAEGNRMRNFAFDTDTFDAEYLLTIRVNGRPIVTVGEPAGPGGAPTIFHIWDGLPDDDSEDPINTFYVSKFGGNSNKAWEAAVREAYQMAITKLAKENASVEEGSLAG